MDLYENLYDSHTTLFCFILFYFYYTLECPQRPRQKPWQTIQGISPDGFSIPGLWPGYLQKPRAEPNIVAKVFAKVFADVFAEA